MIRGDMSKPKFLPACLSLCDGLMECFSAHSNETREHLSDDAA